MMKLPFAGPGYRHVLRQEGDGSWVWQFFRLRNKLASGTCATEEEARSCLKEAIGKFVLEDQEQSQARAVARQKLKYIVSRRLHLTCGVVQELILGKGDTKRAVLGAEEAEQWWWEKDASKNKKPLPTHHLTLKAPEAARRLCELFKETGLLQYDADGNCSTEKLGRWADEMLGNFFMEYTDRAKPERHVEDDTVLYLHAPDQKTKATKGNAASNRRRAGRSTD